LARSSAWEGLTYRPIGMPDRAVRDLFGFVGAWAPPDSTVDFGWSGWAGDRLIGAVLLEKSGSAGMLHGPVVVAPGAAEPGGPPGALPSPAGAPPGAGDVPAGEALEVAAQLLTETLAHAGTRGIDTLFTRPQGLDPVWVRLGFIPVPEVELPRGLRGRPGLGLFAWRGGTALWSAAGRSAAPGRARARR
jgi:hypothetical protein